MHLKYLEKEYTCNIKFIESFRFKYGIYERLEYENPIKKLMLRTRFFNGFSGSLAL